MRNNKKGFTLVELLVVIAILAILASVAVVGYTAFIEKAEQSNIDTEIHQIETNINAELMVSEAVKVADGIYLINTDAGLKIATCEPKDMDVADISANLAGFTITVDSTSKCLEYSNTDFMTAVEVITHATSGTCTNCGVTTPAADPADPQG